MAKRGRRRKEGVRSPNGRLSSAQPADCGPLEAQEKRRALVGSNGDPVLSATAPGILYARGYLNRRQYDAAIRYRRLRCALYGPPWPTNVKGGEASEGGVLRLKEQFEAIVQRLTWVQRYVVSEVSVFDWLPRREKEIKVLREGLDATIYKAAVVG